VESRRRRRLGLLVLICPAPSLPMANAVLRTSQSVLKLVSPLLGAGLYATVGPVPAILLDAATFLFAAVIVAVIPVGRQPVSAGERASSSITRELVAGIRALRSDERLWWLTVASALYMLFAGLNEAAIWAVVTSLLKLEPAFMGIIQLAIGIGSLVGGFLAAPLINRSSFLIAFSVAMAAFAVGNAMMCIGITAVVLAGAGFNGLSQSIAFVAAVSAVQTHTEHALQGRVFGAFEMAATAPQIVSVAIGASLLVLVDFRILLIVGGMVAAGIAVALWARSRSLRSLALSNSRNG
jgi:hypothetical protein